MKNTTRESIRGRIFELVAIIVTAAGKFILGDLLGLGLYYVVLACAFWIGYVLLRVRWHRSVLVRWGFTRHGVFAGLKLVGPVAAVSLTSFVIYGLVTGGAVVNLEFVLLLLLYPIWGTIQQFMVVALLADNVAALSRERVPEWAAILLAAVLFAMVHLPEYPLVAATFVLGLVTTTTFFRTRSIWISGLFHGWYATVFYHFVMGENPLGILFRGAFAVS